MKINKKIEKFRDQISLQLESQVDYWQIWVPVREEIGLPIINQFSRIAFPVYHSVSDQVNQSIKLQVSDQVNQLIKSHNEKI